jgi:hypothetical protein
VEREQTKSICPPFTAHCAAIFYAPHSSIFQPNTRCKSDFVCAFCKSIQEWWLEGPIPKWETAIFAPRGRSTRWQTSTIQTSCDISRFKRNLASGSISDYSTHQALEPKHDKFGRTMLGFENKQWRQRCARYLGPRNLQKSVAWPLLVVIVCAGSYVYAQPQAAKITKIKLEDYGWQPIPNRRELFGHEFSQNLWLDHKGRVLVGFTVRESDALATREHPGRSFHIVRFTAEGKVDLSIALPTDSWYANAFYLGPHDQILARANHALQLLLEDQGDQRSRSWQALAPCPETCFISQSFSRRTLILRVELPVGGRDRSAYTILDASSSPPRVVRTCSQMASMRITDKFAYRMNYDRDDNLTVRFAFCDVEHYEEFPKWGSGGWRYIINDETLLKTGDAKGKPFRADLIGIDGQVRFSKELPRHDSIDPYKITIDEGSDRFAFRVNTEQGAHPSLDIGGHLIARRVLVLDATGKQLASIPTETHYQIDSNFSLSPDGHRLAILEQGVVTVVELQ